MPETSPADPLRHLSQPAAAWFRDVFGAPTAAQAGAWESLSTGAHTLVVAPTGSGKTLSAFLLAVDRLLTAERPDEAAPRRTRVLYISPLKALAVDIERNLRAPLAGIRQHLTADGRDAPPVTVGIRTGDTPPDERRRQRTHPPDILVTTPESLFLLLTSAARETLAHVETVIIDEIHALAGTKRGAHLALSLERLDDLIRATGDDSPQRVGLSATVRPHDVAARFLVGAAPSAAAPSAAGHSTRPVEIVAPPSEKRFDLTVCVPVEDMADLSTLEPEVHTPAGLPGQGSIWPHVERRIVDLVTAHRSTIVFVNSRRLAERLTARINEIHAQDLDPDGAPAPPNRPPAQIMAQSEVALGAPAELAMAHHGSVSKERRGDIEDALKTGRLKAVVATSSLELGIDMGDVDLVVQVQAPPSIRSGLQRVGRAGHQVGEVSRAVLFPTHRADLLSCAVAVERMAAGAIESTDVVANPIDVLAQQTVAACALDDLDVEQWFDAVRRTANFADLSREVFDACLDMLAGKYPSADFAELRPRVVWDRDAGVLRGRPGAQRLAVTSGGTIPDRGNFGVFLVGEKLSRVGELDEEMVYETRVGDVVALGASSWRVEEITHDRVLVSPAPGGSGRLPFWLGDDLGRPAELGAALGDFVRSVDADLAGSPSGAEPAESRLTSGGLDAFARRNLESYLADQRAATTAVPSDRTLVVERFRDDLGDWRVVLHSPYGAGVHQPWAVAVRARLSQAHGFDPVPVASDDGIVLRIPDMLDHTGAPAVPGADLFALDPDEARDLVTAHVGESSLFASRFRECSARALLLPRRDPGKRSPLWQQRQRSAQLLDVARRYPDFPIVLEALRECLQDVYDLPALAGVLTDIASDAIRLVEVDTPAASPFAQALLFSYVGQFVYEGDAPLAEKRAAALSIDTSLLAQLLGDVRLRELLDPDVLDDVERRLQHLTAERAIRDAEGAADLLRLLGPLTTAEITARSSADESAVREWLAGLVAERRIVSLSWAGTDWWAVVEDVARLRDALGVPAPRGIPAALLDPAGDPLGDLARRYARTRGPFTAADLAARFGLGAAVARAVCDRLTGEGALLAGEFRPGADAPEWCDPEVMRQIRRRTLAALRSQIEPVAPAALARFLPDWTGHAAGHAAGHGASRRAPRESGIDGLLAAIDQLDGLAIPVSALEPLVLAPRVAGYSPALLDELLASGEVLWCGRGRSGTRDGLVSLHLSESAPLTLPLPTATSLRTATGLPGGDGHPRVAVRTALSGGALFFRELVERVKAAPPPDDDAPAHPDQTAGAEAVPPSEAAIRDALWDLVWDSAATNDTFAPVRSVLAGGAGRTTAGAHAQPALRRRPTRGGRRPRPQALRTAPALGGRWSLLPAPEEDPTLRAHLWAELMLARHGVVTRGAVEAEQIPGGFAAMYKVLATMEEPGECRRGYFVEGLGAAQFAAGSTIDRLRQFDDSADDTEWPSGAATPQVIVLAATDPANPYGAALAWPEMGRAAVTSGHRPGRKAGALVVLVDGLLALFVERGGRRVLTGHGGPPAETGESELVRRGAAALAASLTDGTLGRPSLTIEQIDSEPAATSAHARAFTAAGFVAVPKGLRISGKAGR